MLAKALGVSGFMVAVTKLSTNDWSQKRFNDIKEQVAPFLENSCGFSNVTFIPIDSINNVNIHKPIENSWYKGPCLIDYLNTLPLPERKPLAPLRIPIIDKFK
jgi:translation elongation factor EF-1alpha